MFNGFVKQHESANYGQFFLPTLTSKIVVFPTEQEVKLFIWFVPLPFS
jgi:hypothetical protein